MQRKQSVKRQQSTKSRTTRTGTINQKKSHILRKLIWGLCGLIVCGIIAVSAYFIVRNNANKTELGANISAPAPAEFFDNNTMFFATNGGIPDVNNDRELHNPDAFSITYSVESGEYRPAFDVNIDESDLTQYVKITPFIRGTWKINGDTITFYPESWWPAGTKFTVKTDKKLFNPDTRPNTLRTSFTTPDITATIDNFNMYPAPNDKKSVIGVAVISFNYEIDTSHFDDKVSVKLDGDKLGFTTKFDKFHRTAFIITEPVKITSEPQIIRVKLNRVPAMSGDSRTEKINANLTLESADNIFKIANMETAVADDTDGNAQQLILLNTTTSARSGIDWSKYITAYLLPKYHNDSERANETPHTWARDEITDTVLQESEKLTITPMDFATPNGVFQYAFSFDVSDKTARYIYLDIKPGADSENGFTMKNGLTGVLPVPYPERAVKIAGSGALLSLAGDRQLGIVARGGVDTAYVNLYKIKSSEINHLISQTYNVFAQSMEFKSYAFGVYDMSVVFQKKISFANPSMTRTDYASVDLGDYLDRTYGDNTGIFIVQTGTSENQTEFNDKRLILLTDMGIIRKVNLDGSSAVFVSKLSDGTPAGDIEISVLGRNGNAVWAGRTDANGRANIPELPWSEYRGAREPVAVVARNGNDVSFIPYNAYNQQVEYSKFDIDGIYTTASTPLNAFMFSDRGIYRPGEELTIGAIVKNKTFTALAGIPVKFQMYDSRGRVAMEKTFSLKPNGMFDLEFDIPNDAPLGSWTAYLYSLTSTNNLDDMLGMTTFNVQEFTPDTMKITANINGALDDGWIPSDNITANVSLRNLFGTPASDRRISAHATLTPTKFAFPEYPEYEFTPNFISGTGLADNTARRAQTFTADLTDTRTDANGTATLALDFNQHIPNGTYTLTLNIRGFESNAGTGVQTNITTQVSDYKYLIGWHANSDLEYINTNAPRTVNIVALDHTATPTAVPDLTLRIIRRENQTSLVKDYNNFYKYQTVSRDHIVFQNKIDIPTTGTDIKLDTTTGGTYFAQIVDASDRILANIEYFVAGTENTSLETDTTAELQIKLNRNQYAPGDDISVSITAPYTGTGLITIERDKVYAYKWFRTNSTSSIQHITLPDGFTGTGYVNVSFVRDINSRDVFTTPYAYAVAPFSADTSAQEINISLDVPEKITNNQLAVKYTTSADSDIMIFAVNRGILQVAKYQIPNPIAHFFEKSALQVSTYQILSLLLPEYKILREYAKTGGGDYGTTDGAGAIAQNPFARNNLPPVAFYSKIIHTRANVPGTVNFEIPDYFNGELAVFAVATNATAVGSGDTKTLVQSPVIISTSAPLAVAPGDTFKINSVITNMIQNSGPDTPATGTISATSGLEITGNTTQTGTISENSDRLFTFDARATDKLGNADITVQATLSPTNADDMSRTSTTGLSVRPATTYTTKITTGIMDSDTTTVSKFHTDMYPEQMTNHLYVSRGALGMIMPLFEYLRNYEYPCTEQLVSRAMPYAIIPTNDFLGIDHDASNKKISETINALKNRQNYDGSFALWSGDASARDTASDANTAYLTAYTVHFLTIARDMGFAVPNEMLSRGIDYLRTYAGQTITDDASARATAYAIYTVSINDYVTTNYIDTFTQYANENIPEWESGLMGAYIASSYKILKQDNIAYDLIEKYAMSDRPQFEYFNMYDNNVANDAMYYYLMARHFTPKNITESNAIWNYVSSGNYDAYTSAIVIMGLTTAPDTDSISEIGITTNSDTATITTESESGIIATIPSDATELELKCPSCSSDSPLFYTIYQAGYPTHTSPTSDGLEISRKYYDANGNQITSATVGDTITVKISARTRGDTKHADNVVIVDLLPGGFTPTPDSITGDMEFSESREDRVLIYTDLDRTTHEFTYTVTAGAIGKFTIPAITAESMYNSAIRATDDTGTFTVLNESN